MYVCIYEQLVPTHNFVSSSTASRSLDYQVDIIKPRNSSREVLQQTPYKLLTRVRIKSSFHDKQSIQVRRFLCEVSGRTIPASIFTRN